MFSVQPPRRTYEGLRMVFDLDDLSQSWLLSASDYKSKGYHNYYTKGFMDHLLRTIIVTTCFPLSGGEESHATNLLSAGRYDYKESILSHVERQYNFQRQSVLNNAEDVILTCLCMMTARFPEDRIIREYSDDLVSLTYITLAEYHNKLFESFVKWSKHVGASSYFPWNTSQLPYQWQKVQGDLSDDARLLAEGAMVMFEIVLYRSIWGEVSVIRHMPECMNFLFHWAIQSWINTSKGVDGPEHDREPFLDSVAVLCQRVRDEQWNGIKRRMHIDHEARLHYDDLNELFWTRDCVKWLQKRQKRNKKDIAKGQALPLLECSDRLNAKNVKQLIDYITRHEEANKGRKTFTEIRSYVFVFLSFYRIVYFHTVMFPLTWTIYRYLNGSESTNFQVMITVAPAALRFIRVMVEVAIGLLSGVFFSFTKKGWSMKQFITVVFNLLLSLYVGLIFYTVGWASPLFRFTSIQSLLVAWPVLILYVLHELSYFAHCRLTSNGDSIVDNLQKSKIGRFLTSFFWLDDGDFIGNKSNLGQPILDVLFYQIIWIVIFGLKTIYWIFMMCPIINESVSYLNMVELRPFFVANVATMNDMSAPIFTACVWVPTIALYFYDTQVNSNPILISFHLYLISLRVFAWLVVMICAADVVSKRGLYVRIFDDGDVLMNAMLRMSNGMQ